MSLAKKLLFGVFMLVLIVTAALGGTWYFLHRKMHQPDHGSMDMSGMDMDATGGEQQSSTDVPGHASITLASELQQRIGIQTGQVEKAPLNADSLLKLAS